MAGQKPSKEDWDTMLASLELGLETLGVSAPLRVARSVVEMIKRHWTQDGKLQPELERNKALELIEEAIDPLAGAALEHADDLEEIKRQLDQVVDLLLRVVAEVPVRNEFDDGHDAEPVLFEGPRQTPARAISYFVGREQEVARLEALLLSDSRTVCVVATGIGGIGKTTLAEEFVATLAPDLFPDGTAWLDGRNLVGELGRVSRRFGWTDERQPTPEEAISLLGRALHSQQVLLVVDNFDPALADPEHVPCPGGRCRTLVTSRMRTLAVRLDAAQLELDVWTLEVCREYLHDRCPQLKTTPDAAIDDLAQGVGRLPLAVRLLAATMNHRQSLSAPEISQMLKQQPLGVLDKYDKDRGIAATFQFSFNALTEQSRQVLQALAVCARQTRPGIVAAVAQVGDAGESLDDLHALGLAEYSDGSSAPWGLHDVVRLFVIEQPGYDSLVLRHVAWVQQYLKDHADPTAHHEISMGLDEARAAFEHLLRAAPADAHAVYQPIESHLRLVGRYSEAIELSEMLLDVVPEYSAAAAEVLNNLGRCHLTLGDIPKAIERHTRAIAIDERLGDLNGQTSGLGYLAQCYETLGDIHAAMKYLGRVIEIVRRTRNLSNAQAAMSMMGLCAMRLGDAPKAIEFLEQALKLAEEYGDRRGQAVDLGNLGLSYAELSDFPAAIACHKRAIAIDEGLGDLAGQASGLSNLGNCYQQLGEIHEAVNLYERALEINESIGRARGVAANLTNLALCHETLGDSRTAIELFQRVLGIEESRGVRDGQASALSGMGLCYLSMGEVHTAMDCLNRSLAIIDSVTDPDGLSAALGNLGLCHMALGEMPEAIDLFTRALAVDEELGDRVGEANCLTNLGACYLDCDNLASAVVVIQRGLAIGEELGSLEIQAANLCNLGKAAAKRGDTQEYRRCVKRGLEFYRRMGMPEDGPQIARWVLMGFD